ncbi:MAG TPA: uroporphyrinogen decarboxylase family protein [Gaiellaceae bacterium]|nr:uroporphyrinogen decarboxylase family protein [Gaiellaceae bacterium]
MTTVPAEQATSRRRVDLALAHVEPDRVPLDLGAAPTTGMHVDSVYALRQALGLDPPGTPVKVSEPFQMLGEIGPDLIEALGVDVVGVGPQTNFFGFAQDGWKPWTTFAGTPVLVPGLFPTEPDEHGDILMYPQGDTSVPPCARMPNGGFYFDAISRQQPLDEDALDPADNAEEFTPLTQDDLAHVQREAARLAAEGKAVMFVVGDTGFGDIAFVPGLKLKHPRGIRDVEQWYMSLTLRPRYVYEVFERQCEVGIRNLEAVHAVAGDAISVVYVTGTDFGAQDRPFLSPTLYRNLFKPFHRRVNEWIHTHTAWKSFMHTDGSIRRLLDDFVEAGFDILNPVQTSAAEMDPAELKAAFGDRITFWGGGIETQTVLPFGTPEEVRAQVRERMRIFGPGGGFVFSTIHNLQARVPVENIVALYEAVNDYRTYPLR